MKLAVLGAGAWGTALSITLAARHAVTLWARDPMQADHLARERENSRYLRGCPIPAAIRVTADPASFTGVDAVVAAVPTAALRDTLTRLRSSSVPVVLACKGFEAGTGRLPHEVVAEVLGAKMTVAVLSGPSFALEVAHGLPAALTLACADSSTGRALAQALHGARLRVYSGEDVPGVEVAGATKNVIAIAAGICDGLRLGLNARAALVTRGLAEVTRLGRRLGGRTETFMGLAGAGDLILTCTGDLSRNRTVGMRLAAGQSLAHILAELGHVAEGVYTARAIDAMADQLEVDMPITRAVRRVLDGEQVPTDAVSQLLERDPKSEF